MSILRLLLLGLFVVSTQPVAALPQDEDLSAARAVFERNIRAIQERNRDDYLACYLESDSLIRSGPEGMSFGFSGLADSAPATGSDDWPVELVASDLQLARVREGLVYGTYRYRVFFGDGPAVDGLSERLFVETPEGWKIALTTAFAATQETPPPPVALVGATLYDGSGGAPVEDAVVVVRGGRFDAVGPRAAVEVPTGVDVVDLSGSWIVPGLIDTHVHYSQTGWADGRPDSVDVTADHPYAQAMADCERYPERFHRAFLASGVTAVFDVGGYPWTRRLRAEAEGSVDAPHVSATGPLLATWDPGFGLVDRRQFVLMEDEDGVRAAVRSHVASGSDAIKIWFIVRSPDDLETYGPLVHAAADEAKALEVPVAVHATALEAARIAVEAGAHLLVHSVDDAPVDDAFVAALVERGTYYCPTLTVLEGYGMLFRASLTDELRSQLAFVDPTVRARALATEELPPRLAGRAAEALTERWKGMREQMHANLLRVHRAGGRVVMGTDAGNPLTLHGPSVFPEMEAMQAAGLTPAEVLVASTSAAAEAMGRGAELGRVAEGYVADLVVVGKDPGEDVSHLRTVERVLRRGRLHERRQLVRR